MTKNKETIRKKYKEAQDRILENPLNINRYVNYNLDSPNWNKTYLYENDNETEEQRQTRERLITNLTSKIMDKFMLDGNLLHEILFAKELLMLFRPWDSQSDKTMEALYTALRRLLQSIVDLPRKIDALLIDLERGSDLEVIQTSYLDLIEEMDIEEDVRIKESLEKEGIEWITKKYYIDN